MSPDSAPVLTGLLNLHKPPGWSSRDVVNRVERLVKPAKAGHAGTLDPLAEGVLVVCVGTSTRLLQYVQADTKEYIAEFQFGLRSDTDDITGDVIESENVSPVTREQIKALFPRYLGEIQQVPPQYSAIQVGGRRAYHLARSGATVPLESRAVRIDALEILEYGWPRLRLRVVCGAGTYIRSLARDFGEELGCGGVMTALIRTRIGDYTVERAVAIDSLTRESITEALQPPLTAVAHWPRMICTPAEVWEIAHGRSLPRSVADDALAGTSPDTVQGIALVDQQGELIALGAIHPERGLKPTSVFVDRTLLLPPETTAVTGNSATIQQDV